MTHRPTSSPGPDHSTGRTGRSHSHLISVDVEDPPNFAELISTHEVMHQTDGSIPTMADQDVD